MANQLRSIKEIDATTNRWSAKVMVIEKGFPRIGASNRPFQKLMFVDVEGTKIQGAIFGDDIEVLQNTLQLFTTYSISNAMVKLVTPEHRIVNNDYQWNKSGRTCIEEINDEMLTIRSLAFDFVRLNQLEHLLEEVQQSAEELQHSVQRQQQDIDVLFAVIHVAPIRKIKSTSRDESSLREIVIIDQEMKPIILTLWDQFGSNEGSAMSNMSAPFPIVIGMRLKVTAYNGLTLSTKSASTFIFDPPIPQADALLTWCVTHEQAIKAIPLDTLHQMRTAQSPPPTANKIISISQLPTSIAQPANYWIRATAKVQNFNQKFWYICCSKCNKGTDAGPNDIFHCNYCKEKAQAEPRCKFDVQLEDSSGKTTATIFGTQAEKLFSINAAKCMENTSISGQVSLEVLRSLCIMDEQIIQLRAYEFHTAGVPHCKFNINAVHQKCLPTTKHSTFETISPPLPKKPRKEFFSPKATSSEAQESSEA